jgi:hypothetical protein
MVARLAQILYLMRDIVARHAVKAGERQLAMVAFCVRLGWFFDRLDRLVHRWRTNTLPTPRRRPQGAPPRARTPANPRPVHPGHRVLPPIPRRRGWLLLLVQPAAQLRPAFIDFLTRDDIRQLVADAPQAGRLLRPLCHALAAPLPDWLRLPRRPRKPTAPKPAPQPAPRPARPASPPPPDRPIEPYVLAAARVWKPRHG